jgi:predicted Zn-dependent peptidase
MFKVSTMTVSTSPLYHTYQISNGIQIVGQSMPDFESIALCLYVHTDTLNEDTHVAGISHYPEHINFNGTIMLDWQQLKQEFTRIGPKRTALLQLSITFTISVYWRSI